MLEQFASGGFGKVHKMIRKSDQRMFALKYVENVSSADKTMAINEASLISHLKSDEMIQCEDIYFHNNSMYIILEMMD